MTNEPSTYFYSTAITPRGAVVIERGYGCRQYAEENAAHWNGNGNGSGAVWVVLPERAMQVLRDW